MRVVVGGFVHETNTYADRTTGPTDRSRFTELRGSALLERNFAAAHPGGSSIGGFISGDESCRKEDERRYLKADVSVQCI